MSKKSKWNELSHDDKITALRDTALEQIAADYDFDELDQSDALRLLRQESALWQPSLYGGKAIRIGDPPNKEVVLGAWRDLDRSEAILELIDNSIDAWSRRRALYPNKTAADLNIYIDVDSDSGRLTYEDNAGGVPIAKLINLVVPGYSETDAVASSIGSYKTGGKKAIFRLATAVNITTAYWNPAGSGDQAVSVHLDHRWLSDVTEYKFPYFPLRDMSSIEKGQTRYVMQLRPEPVGNPWFSNPMEREKISRDIQRIYSLLMTRQRNINIYFPTRGKTITPNLNEFYDFSGTHDSKTDIRPQRARFNMKLDYEGTPRPLTIEVVIGCRTTSAIRDGKGPGFDLYGNNRLFVSRDDRLFADLLPKGSVALYIRGLVNIIGPNVFVPWDTHKRHLNYDREVIGILRHHPAIKNLFENWSSAFSQIRSSEVTKTVGTPLSTLVDLKTGDFAVPHTFDFELDISKKRGQKLPENVFKPKVGVTKAKKDSGLQLNINLTTGEGRQLAAHFEVEGALDSRQTKVALSERAKEHLLNLVGKRKAK